MTFSVDVLLHVADLPPLAAVIEPMDDAGSVERVASSNLAVMPSARFLQMMPFTWARMFTPLIAFGQGEIQVSVLAT
jgi:hypothetical protein